MPTVKIHDFHMEYRTFGSGEPLLMLHGSGADWRLFEPQIEGLGKHFELIIPHMRGHAGSSPLPPAPFYHDGMAEDTKLFLDALGLNNVHVYGESMGAVVALLLGIKYPQFVKKLVPVCGFSEMPGADSALLLKVSTLFFSLFSMQTILNMMKATYSKKKPGEALAREIISKSVCIDKSTFVELKTRPLRNFTAELGQIQAPALIMGGTGLKLEERGSRNLFQYIPGATLALFEGNKDPLSVTGQIPHDGLLTDFLLDRPLKEYDGVKIFRKNG